MTLVTHPPLSTWRCISRVTLPASAPSSLLCCQRLAPVGEAWGLPELMMTLWVTLSHSGFSIRKVTCLSYGPPSLSLAFEITNMIPWSSYAYFFVLFLNYFRTWLLKRVIYWVSLLAHQQAILPTAPFFFFFLSPVGFQNSCLVIQLEKSHYHWPSSHSRSMFAVHQTHPKGWTCPVPSFLQWILSPMTLQGFLIILQLRSIISNCPIVLRKRKTWSCRLSVLSAHCHNPKGKECKNISCKNSSDPLRLWISPPGQSSQAAMDSWYLHTGL